MNRLSLAVVNSDGALKCVLSEHGRVIFDDSARLPHDPNARHLASALRLLADRIEDSNATGYKAFKQSAR